MGKSTLFNRLTKSRQAIVSDEGYGKNEYIETTRSWHYVYDENGKKIGESVPGIFGGYTEYDEKGHTTGFDARVRDSWNQDYVYVSEPPYTSFIVFSKGPDGKYDKNHPADRSKAENKDNIYGDLGDK